MKYSTLLIACLGMPVCVAALYAFSFSFRGMLFQNACSVPWGVWAVNLLALVTVTIVAFCSERTIRLERVRLANILEFSGAGIFLIEGKFHRICFVNFAATTILHRPSKELLGIPFEKLFNLKPRSIEYDWQEIDLDTVQRKISILFSVHKCLGYMWECVFVDITAKNNLMARLIREVDESDLKGRTLEALMKHIPDGIAVAHVESDTKEVIIDSLSEYGTQHLGLRVEEPMTMESILLRHPVFKADGITLIQKYDLPLVIACRTGKFVHDLELVQHNEKGDIVYLLCNAAPIHSSSGDITGGILVWHDISEWKRTVEELKKNKAVLESFFSTSPGMLIILDEDKRFVAADNNTTTCFGFTSKQIVGKTIKEVFPCGVAEHVLSVVEQVQASEVPVLNSEVPLSLIDSDMRCWRVSYFVVPLPRGRKGIGVHGMDISDMKNAELRLIHSEEKFRLLTDSIPHLVWTANPSGEYDYGNRQWQISTAISANSALGYGWLSIVHPDDREETVSKWKQALESEILYEHHHRLKNPAGAYRWKMTRAVPVRDSAGKVVKWLGSTTDVHEQKEAAKQLEDRVIERTAELTKLNMELQTARDAAMDSMKAKSQFLANMSHEIRTPLNAIIGLTSLLLDSELSATQRSYIQDVQTQGEVLLSVINSVLDLSKLEAGRVKLVMRSFDLTALINATLSMFKLSAEVKGIKLHPQVRTSVFSQNVVPTTIPVVGDADRLRQILINLIGNAVKFTSAGEVRVEMQITPSLISKTGIISKISVYDTGIGITPSDINNLFQPFTQADLSTTRRFGGTGLGLSISRLLADLMYGTIELQSKLDVGSVFTLTLPLEKAPHIEQAKLPLDNRKLPVSSFSLQILVVEDNPVNQRVITAQLKKLGHEVTLACNGQDALAKLEHKSSMLTASDPLPFGFDLVLMDCQMPVMDGYQAAQQIRRMEMEKGHTSHTPIIALTAHALEGDREKCISAGMDEYLAKPVPLEVIATTTARWAAEKCLHT